MACRLIGAKQLPDIVLAYSRLGHIHFFGRCWLIYWDIRRKRKKDETKL